MRGRQGSAGGICPDPSGCSGGEGYHFYLHGYEKEVVASLAEDLPRYREKLLALQARFKDLHAAIRRYFYHPEFHGSFSLKSVLPALVPAMKYESLAIQEGSMASLEYLRMLDPSTPSEEKRTNQKGPFDLLRA